MKRILLLFIFFIAIGVYAPKAQYCQHRVALTDSYGDGWNGGFLDILVNDSIVLDSITLNSGFGPGVFYFIAENNDRIDALYTAGVWPDENEYTVYDGYDSIIGQSGQWGTPDSILIMTGNCSSCSPPVEMFEANVTPNTAILKWDETGDATEWEYQVVQTGIGPASTGISTVTNPQFISGLYYRRTYDWYVRASCGGVEYSPWIGPKTFTTSSMTVGFPFYEDWESGSVDYNWAVYSAAYTHLEVNTASKHTGLYGLTQYGNNINYSTPNGINDAWVKAQISTGVNEMHTSYNEVVVDLSEAIDPELSFYYAMGYDTDNNHNNFWVIVESATTGWIQLFSTQTNDVTSDYAKVVLSLSDYTGDTLKIRFFHNGRYSSNYLWLDDIAIRSCLPPTNLSETNITPSSVELNWAESGTATTWEYQYGIMGYTPIDTGIIVTINRAYVMDLIPKTSYDWYVRSSCGDSLYSAWVGPDSFQSQVDAIEVTKDIHSIQVWTSNNSIFILNPQMKLGRIMVSNLIGQEIAEIKLTGDTKQSQILNIDNSINIIQIRVEGEVIMKKIF